MGAQAAAGAAGGLNTLASFAGGMQARYNAEAEQKLQDQNNKEIDKAALENYSELSATEVSINRAAGESSLDQQKAFFKARGQQLVSSGASGTAGGSVDMVMKDLVATKGKNLSNIAFNRRQQLDEVVSQAKAIQQGAKAAKSNRIFNKPSMGMIALNTAAQAAESYGSYKAAAPKKP